MDPYWMYKIGRGGKLISKVFTTKKIPKGWSDSPKAAKAAKGQTVDTPEVEDDNSTGNNQQLSETSRDFGRGSDAGSGDQLGCLDPIESDAKPLA